MIKVNSEQRNANPRCSICWEDFTAEERIAELPCNHIYHEPCIVPWMQSNNNCPICRRVFPGNLHNLNAVQKSKNHCGANDLSITVISNRKCHEKCVLFAPQWFFDF
jgi:hypothetical protein